MEAVRASSSRLQPGNGSQPAAGHSERTAAQST